jgi:branched-chain amino acid transport system substrate-binding protein
MSNHALAVAPVAQQAGVPFVAVNTGGDSQLTSVGLPSTATDFSAVVTSVLATDADSVALLTRAGAVQMITQLRQAGYDGVIWSQAALGGGAAVAGAPVTEGVLYTVNAAAGSDIPSMKEFFDGYRETYGKDGYAFAAQGYDAVWAVAHAAEKAGCATRQCIQDGLQELTESGFEGALGELTFKDRNAVGPGAIVTIRDGVETFVR